jgi:hypothetical protein
MALWAVLWIAAGTGVCTYRGFGAKRFPPDITTSMQRMYKKPPGYVHRARHTLSSPALTLAHTAGAAPSLAAAAEAAAAAAAEAAAAAASLVAAAAAAASLVAGPTNGRAGRSLAPACARRRAPRQRLQRARTGKQACGPSCLHTHTHTHTLSLSHTHTASLTGSRTNWRGSWRLQRQTTRLTVASALRSTQAGPSASAGSSTCSQ